jgi:hypothetical protein
LNRIIRQIDLGLVIIQTVVHFKVNLKWFQIKNDGFFILASLIAITGAAEVKPSRLRIQTQNSASDSS